MDINSRLEGHVYLVEDNDDIRIHLATMMRHYGLTVECAQLYQKNRFGLNPR